MIPHHEFWNPNILLATIWPHYLWNGIKLGDLTYFTATNPAIEDGGFFGESKKDILGLIPEDYLPKTLFVSKDKTWDESVLDGFQFPLIVKPDVGERGRGVKKLQSFEELENYFRNSEETFLVQEFIDYPCEYGLLYYSMPDSNESGITSLIKKEFLTIEGDGYSTIRQILQKDKRNYRYIAQFDEAMLNRVPLKSENILLQPIGNHSRGTIFRNAAHLITPKLIQKIDEIAEAMPGFYYGRFDLKAPSDEAILNGEDICILELNGMTSDPAHIFDPEYPLLQALKDLRADAQLITRIAKANKKRGVKTTPLYEIIQKTRKFYFSK